MDGNLDLNQEKNEEIFHFEKIIEEMKTTKEELESLNEELTVVNTQLQQKIDLQDRINADLVGLFTSTKVATIFLDMDLRIKRFTPEAQSLFNFKDCDIERQISDLTKNFKDDNFENDMKEVLKRDVSLEREIETYNNNWYLRKIFSYKTKNNETTGLVITFFNVTGLKKKQDLLEKSERKIIKTIKKIKNTNEELKNFAYICAHDLQEPVRTILSFSKLLNEHLWDSDEESKKYIDYIICSSGHMENMIKDALNYAEMSSDSKKIININMNELLENVINNLGFLVKESKAEIICGKLPNIIGDPIRINAVFQNLLSNSLKFRNKKSNTKISVGVKHTKSGYIFSVRDNGIGMDMKHTKKLFQLFRRLNKKEDYPGTGIGLAICKKIINALGGRIWLESEPGIGSSFYFSIPQRK